MRPAGAWRWHGNAPPETTPVTTTYSAESGLVCLALGLGQRIIKRAKKAKSIHRIIFKPSVMRAGVTTSLHVQSLLLVARLYPKPSFAEVFAVGKMQASGEGGGGIASPHCDGLCVIIEMRTIAVLRTGRAVVDAGMGMHWCCAAPSRTHVLFCGPLKLQGYQDSQKRPQTGQAILL
ncbi:hypothetical protein BB8028_0005g08240 [Beauveria bassiana]|uniref:Uncharacterized protein n=1 Tax=Beauveria bassiana TaxID=176275 RepID=A0A2S7YGJ5_BEABA|nr:hypothetical protein BB8028_0005g08240 [Beauveria bassiana]